MNLCPVAVPFGNSSATIGEPTGQHHRPNAMTQATRLTPFAQRRFPDPGNPGHTLPETWYQHVTGLPVPEDQTPIDNLQCQIVAGLSNELDRYHHGAVAIEVVSQWLMDQTHDERLMAAGRYLHNGIGLCRPNKKREQR